MANNFRKVNIGGGGTYYTTKSGSDANTGLTPEQGKATIQNALNTIWGTANSVTATLLIGAGTYEEAISLLFKSSGNSFVAGDGEVLLIGTGVNSVNFNRTSGNNEVRFLDIRIENYSNFTSTTHSWTRCKFRNIPTSGFSYATVKANISYCIFVDCTNISFSGSTAADQIEVSYCIFINCNVTLSSNAKLHNCYFNSASNLTLPAATTAGDINYNNIMGQVRVGTGPYQSLAAHIAANPSYNQNSFNLSPKFNNASKLDFTLQADSPHLTLGSNALLPVGGTTYGRSFTIVDMIAQGAVLNGLELSGSDLVVSPGFTSGTITFPAIKVTDNPEQMGAINFNGLTTFNKSKAGGTTGNQNVPDANVSPNMGGASGATPDRLSYEMRWTDIDEQPAVDAQWTNSGVGAPGVFFKFEINQAPLIDVNAKGNGEPDFVTPGSGISPIYVQPRFTLTNGYV